MSETTDKTREQFEKWAEKDGYYTGRLRNGDYQAIPTDAAWLSWQASRQATIEECARVVQAHKYYERGGGLEDEDPHSDENPDYIRYAIDERLDDAVARIRSLAEGGRVDL